MLFNTPEFFIFLALILTAYYALNYRFQNLFLLAASYTFYAFWDVRFVALILLATCVDYFVGHGLSQAASPTRKRWLLLTSLVVNLGILGYFKYTNFFVESAEKFLNLAGFKVDWPVLYILLPVGVSFYTFQKIAYVIEVYRGQLNPVERFLDFALYVCYFPQLVAGPIERPQHLIPQVLSERVITQEKFVSGWVLILIGLFRKVVIADVISPRIDQIFSAPQDYSTPMLWLGILLFGLQIYCDFAGYSDIARGTSRLLGIELIENFNHPYFSSNISEFWRRWHISLSNWLRNYLFFPLRRSILRRFHNQETLWSLFLPPVITMLLGGLWHGAAWSFVAWGGLHGFYQFLHHLSLRYKKSRIDESQARFTTERVLGALATFLIVDLTWVFFRAPGFQAALQYLVKLFTFENMQTLGSVLPQLIVPWLLVFLVDIPQFLSRDHEVFLKWPKFAREATIAVLLFFVLLGIGTRAPFIYFQF